MLWILAFLVLWLIGIRVLALVHGEEPDADELMRWVLVSAINASLFLIFFDAVWRVLG